MPRGRFNAPRDPQTGRFLKAGQSVSLHEFGRELFEKSNMVPDRVRRRVRSSADEIVKQAKANVQKTAPIHNAGAWRYIDAELRYEESNVTAVVGYNTRHKPARLGNLLEFGNGGDPSPPHWDLARALQSNEREFYNRVGDDAEALLESRWGVIKEGKDLR